MMKLLNKTKGNRSATKRLVGGIEREQLNFLCSKPIITKVRVLSAILELPLYVLMEHMTELGYSHIFNMTSEPHKLKGLLKHLNEAHLGNDILGDEESIV